MKHLFVCRMLIFCAVAFAAFPAFVSAQTKQTPAKSNAKLPKVTQIDAAGLKTAMKMNGRPMLINFWATWCDPCREEFPDLVKIDGEYKGKIDFFTVSLDDPAEISRDVPEFLSEMKAEMPAYLLRVPDEGAVIATITKDWQGGLPFTVLYDQTGAVAYIKQGKFKPEVLRAEIDKLLVSKSDAITSLVIQELPRPVPRGAVEGKADAAADLAKGKFILKRYGMTPTIDPKSLENLKIRFGVEILETGCVLFNVTPEYFASYNETVKSELRRRFGKNVDAELPV